MSHAAIVFPGQGSQSVGMLKEIADRYNEVQDTFIEASTVLGYDLWQLTQQGPAEKLDQTIYTQPALLASSVAVFRILAPRNNFRYSFVAGHSLGEYTALVCTNALAFTDAIKLVAARGKYMQEAVPEGLGGMAAIIGLDDVSIASVCEQAIHSGEILSPANFNSLGQTVIAGHKTAVERALILAKEQGAKMVVNIPVSVPSHCALMKNAANKLGELLAQTKFHKPNVPVINNVDVAQYDSETAIRDGLIRQLYQPVRWVETIQYFIYAGVTSIIECGPGKILTGLNKRIAEDLELTTTTDLASIERIS